MGPIELLFFAIGVFFAFVGVIRGYQAVLNEDKLDLDTVTAVIEVKVTPQREEMIYSHGATISHKIGQDT